MFDEQQADKEWRSLTAKKGSQLVISKLNEKLVVQIRERHAKKKVEIDAINRRHSVEAMAKEFQVSVRTIENALSRATWKHV